ncbi:MAG: DNA mismatch repair endonuclease MutL [Treponema sp.]|jgi:DNA mismatch repair protein MutL|nr:DNA mismatch repair endonuclease MutL [Treponema sp.]
MTAPAGTLAPPAIRVLPPEEAKKIAAGEVIDKPAALVREFIDNAIDAGAQLIETVVEEGGIFKTEVSDDGRGMGKEDLELCILTHATSKIRSMEDLRTAETLGFRGEALAAAAAVSRLEILSSLDGREAWKLSAGPEGKNPARLEQSRRSRGTSVRALGLFDTIPARKRFLKRAGSEAASCRQIFNEKAMAFPGIGFRFIQDGSLKAFLPPANSFKERFIQIFLTGEEGSFLHEIAAGGDGFSLNIVVGGPEIFRNHRRQQFVFANGRRIQDYSLIQALEYGVQGWFPNGIHPLGAVYIDIDPALADFNIHPAKREARFADPGAIHHAVTQGLRDFFRHINAVSSSPAKQGGEAGGYLALEALFEKPPSPPQTGAPLRGEAWAAETRPPYGPERIRAGEKPAPGESLSPAKPRFLGRIFDLFILIEKGDRLFIIDQHAAHERIQYNRFISGPIDEQELLVAIPFDTESLEDDAFLKTRKDDLARLGIRIEAAEGGGWRVEALPDLWRLSDAETVREILGLRSAGANMAERWAATLSCRRAVKDGDYLDEGAALALAEEALKLPVPLCPHGRPIWLEITREDLFRAVKRL